MAQANQNRVTSRTEKAIIKLQMQVEEIFIW